MIFITYKEGQSWITFRECQINIHLLAITILYYNERLRKVIKVMTLKPKVVWTEYDIIKRCLI